MCVIFLVCGVKNRKFFVLVELRSVFFIVKWNCFLEWLFLLCDFESREEDGFWLYVDSVSFIVLVDDKYYLICVVFVY